MTIVSDAQNAKRISSLHTALKLMKSTNNKTRPLILRFQLSTLKKTQAYLYFNPNTSIHQASQLHVYLGCGPSDIALDNARNIVIYAV